MASDEDRIAVDELFKFPEAEAEWKALRAENAALQALADARLEDADTLRRNQEIHRASYSSLIAENAAMREALEFYAQRTSYYENTRIKDGDVDRWPVIDKFPYYNCALRDGGKIARIALGGRDGS